MRNKMTDEQEYCSECGNELNENGDCQMCSQAAAAFEDAAHGYDDGYNPHTGMSEYDLDPGIKYNDGGEPEGYC
jgi:hypothetical protein